MGSQRVRHDWATGLDQTSCPSLGSGLGLYHRSFPPLEALGSSFTPFSLCLLFPGGQVIPYLLGDFGKTEHEKLSPFFLFLLKSPSLRTGVFCSPPASWMAVMRGAGPSTAMTRSEDMALTLIRWRDTGEAADAAILPCVCVLQSQPFFEWDLPSFRLGERHLGFWLWPQRSLSLQSSFIINKTYF